MAPHRSPGSGSTTPIVFKRLIIFNISTSQPHFPPAAARFLVFQGFHDNVGRWPRRCCLVSRNNLHPTRKAASWAGIRGDNMQGILAPLLFSLPPSFGSDFNPTINGTSDSSQHSRS